MNQLHENITLKQFDLMKHAIGIDWQKAKLGKYTAYRNYFHTYEKISDWETLVKYGAATSYTVNHEIYTSAIYYQVSAEGIKLLENILGFKIIVAD